MTVDWPDERALGGHATAGFFFIEHFQQMARGHFAVRRLERKYGPEAIQAEYDRLARAP
jgi:hypothetical protein